MSSVAKVKLSLYILEIEQEWMFEKTETLGVDECWLSPFEFSQTFMDVLLLKE